MSSSKMFRQILMIVLALVILHHSELPSYAQIKPPADPPKPPESDKVQESFKVLIEEVRIPISATDANGRFDPTVSLRDLMVKEDRVVQQLNSVYRIPANVLLLLDTGTGQKSSKDVRLTKAVARTLVSSLQNQDRVAIIQVNNHVEVVQEWTPTFSDAIRSIDHKLLPGKESALVDGLTAAIQQFQTITSGNNHLVLVTDGIDRDGTQSNLSEALHNLVPTNITVHVISYGSLGTKNENLIPTRPREKSAVDKHLIEALPSARLKEDPTPDLKTIMSSKGGVVLDVDKVFPSKGIRDQLELREKEFQAITEETGGNLWLPSSADEMIDRVMDVAQTIDSQYVISYKPLRPLSSVNATEYRKLEVMSRRVGLNIKARRGYVASAVRQPAP